MSESLRHSFNRFVKMADSFSEETSCVGQRCKTVLLWLVWNYFDEKEQKPALLCLNISYI